jgi:hypothetical protein
MGLSEQEIREVLRRHADLWNERRFDEWKSSWLVAAPNGMTMEAPIGAPVRTGWDECWGRTLDRFADWAIRFERQIVTGHEAVVVVRNEQRRDPSSAAVSIEHYRFMPEGTVHMRMFFDRE